MPFFLKKWVTLSLMYTRSLHIRSSFSFRSECVSLFFRVRSFVVVLFGFLSVWMCARFYLQRRNQTIHHLLFYIWRRRRRMHFYLLRRSPRTKRKLWWWSALELWLQQRIDRKKTSNSTWKIGTAATQQPTISLIFIFISSHIYVKLIAFFSLFAVPIQKNDIFISLGACKMSEISMCVDSFYANRRRNT